MNVKQLSGLAALLLAAALPLSALAADRAPWKKTENAIVIDAYELNAIEWSDMLTDGRIAGFISKASDGLPESYSCKGDHGGDTVAHCKTMWRKYAVSRELYETRRLLARSKGLLWGAYHLARPGNPVEQANHFLDYANPQDDEMMVLDIEGRNPETDMSLEDAQVFAGHIKTRTGRYPVLYTNHATARYIAANRAHTASSRACRSGMRATGRRSPAPSRWATGTIMRSGSSPPPPIAPSAAVPTA